ncbi:MAG: helix-turn-helix transcriptional regulator [Hyphomicrobiaceae bacterium]|nr:helix-turn-helix transcriptional regulator [Hyphomicrobiaceae bacterium]
MGNENKLRQSGCPLAFGLDMFGDRWSLLIIREMLLNGKKTYGEFLEIDEGIATNVLSDRLRHLEAEGIITKTRNPENQRSFTYALTEKGRDLAPVLIEIILWSGKHDRRPHALRATLDKIKADRKGFEKKIRSG